MQMKRLIACSILIWPLLSIISFASRSLPLRVEAIDAWVHENYVAVVRRIMPEQLKLSPFPADVKWVVVVVVRRPLSGSEYWVSVTKKYDGTSRVEVRIPHQKPISRQMQELKETNPEATAESIANLVRLDKYEFDDTGIPELRELTKTLEQIRIGPIAPDSLGSDLWEYRYWTESQYGQQMSAQLVGFGPGVKKQPHPLAAWAERVRVTTENYINRKNTNQPPNSGNADFR